MGLRFDWTRGLTLERSARGLEKRDWIADMFVYPQAYRRGGITGPHVDMSSMLGLSTAAAAVRLVSETIGMMPLKVYQGEPPVRAVARDSWQWYRLHEAPNEDRSAFDFWQDVAGSIETSGNAFIWKALARRPVRSEEDIQLILIDPAMVMLKRDPDGKKYYEVRRNGRTERVAASQILHIRSWATTGGDLGVSPLRLHRETLGSALGAREYQSRFFSQGTSLPGFISIEGNALQEDLDRAREEIRARYSGLENAHEIGVLANKATWVPTGISMVDAQYIEIQKFNGEEICRIFRVSPGMVGFLTGTRPVPADDDFERFLKADLAPRLRRIEMALRADTDLFPPGSTLFPEFESGAVLKASTQSRSEAYKNLRQAGVMTANEIRALENLPPAAGGDVLQDTPVGGAPNTMPEPTAPGPG